MGEIEVEGINDTPKGRKKRSRERLCLRREGKELLSGCQAHLNIYEGKSHSHLLG